MILLRSIRIYSAYFAQFLKARLEYRVDFAFNVVAQLFMSFSGLVFIYFLLSGSGVRALAGWSREEVMFIYGYSMLPMALFMMLAPNLYQFGDKYIIQGQFDRVLLRPLNSIFQVLFESFNLESVGSFVAGLGVIVFTAGELGLHFGALDYVWLLASSISGAIILLSVFVVVASLSFHFEDRLGISAPVFNFINFSRYPVTIFNSTIQFVLKWVLPFAFVAFFPATHFLNRDGFKLYCYASPFIAAVSVGIAAVVWRFGVSRYSSTGN